MAAPTEYSKTTWNTGDVITAVKLNNLETQYDKAVTIPNNTFFSGKDAGGTPLNLIGVNTGDDVVIGSAAAAQDDTILQARTTVRILPAGSETARFQAAGPFKMIQDIEVERASPKVTLDRTSGQYAVILCQASGVNKMSFGYDHTADDFVILDDNTGDPIFKLDVEKNWLYSDNEPRASSKLITPQAITTSTRTALIWDTSVYDNDNINDIGGSNPTRHTFVFAGRYLITARILFADGVTGGSRRSAVFQLNGGATDFGLVDIDSDNSLKSLSMCYIYDFASTDYFELDVFHDKSSNLNVSGEVQVQRLLG